MLRTCSVRVALFPAVPAFSVTAVGNGFLDRLGQLQQIKRSVYRVFDISSPEFSLFGTGGYGAIDPRQRGLLAAPLSALLRGILHCAGAVNRQYGYGSATAAH